MGDGVNPLGRSTTPIWALPSTPTPNSIPPIGECWHATIGPCRGQPYRAYFFGTFTSV